MLRYIITSYTSILKHLHILIAAGFRTYTITFKFVYITNIMNIYSQKGGKIRSTVTLGNGR